MADLTQGVSIGIAGDTQAFDKAVRKGVIEPLDDAADKLKELDRTGDLNSVERGMKDAEDASQRLERELDDVVDKLKQTGRAGKSAGEDIDKGTDRAREGIKEIGEESASTAKEAAASFDGSAESIGDAFQEVAANAFAGFGPAGLIAGVAAAAGIGLVIAQLDAAGERSEQVKAKIGQLTEEFIDNGRAVTSNEYAVQYLKDLATAAEEGGTSLTDLAKKTDRAKFPLKDFTDALVGTKEEQRAVVEQLDAAIEATAKLQKETGGAEGTYSDNYEALRRQGKALSELRDQMAEAVGVTEEATVSTDLYSQVATEHAAALEAEQAAQDAATEAVQQAQAARTAAAAALQGELDAGVAAFEDFHNAEANTYDPAGYVEGMRLRNEATVNFNANVQRLASEFGLSTDEVQALLDQGLDFAPMLQSIIDSGLAPSFIEQLRGAVGGGQEILNGSGLNATVSVKADQQPAESTLAEVEKRDRKAEVKATADPAEADRQLAELAARQRVATITARLDAGGVEAALNSLARNRSMTITARMVDQNGRTVYQ